MFGAPDPLYVAARRALLDAIDAVREHLDAIVMVGAQAVYVHAGSADLAVAPYTTDGDLAIDPARLRPEPLLEERLSAAGFLSSSNEVGVWRKRLSVEGIRRYVVLDLLVPDSLGGPGRRGARIPPHGNRVARKVAGLEGTLVDNDLRKIGSLESDDVRAFEVSVAGPSGLLVAKIFKINDRAENPDRLNDKDALDVFRLLRVIPTSELVRRFAILREDERSREVTEQALEQLPEIFGRPQAPGCLMAARAAAPAEPEETVATAAAFLTQDLLNAL